MKQQLPLYQVDAFTDRLFSGNPAAVVVLSESLAEPLMQKIAAENNLAETAFIKPEAQGCYDIRWFTPAAEVPLCGHATLASALVVFDYLQPQLNSVRFNSASGELLVVKNAQRLTLNLPASFSRPIANPYPEIDAQVLACERVEAPAAKLLLRLVSQQAVLDFRPDFAAIAALPYQGLILTAEAESPSTDFVSRFFAPRIGINEDPVTGAAHCVLTPYWSAVLNKTDLSAKQISSRGGDLSCRLIGDRVELGGQGVCYLRGSIELPQ